MNLYDKMLTDCAGEREFNRAMVRVLLDVLLRENPELIKQHGSHYAKQAADRATRWVADIAAKARQEETDDSVFSEDTGVAVANSIAQERQRFEDRLKGRIDGQIEEFLGE